MKGTALPIHPESAYKDKWEGWDVFLGTGRPRRCSRRPWTKEEVVADARKYKTRGAWERNSAGAIRAARRHPDWYAEATAHMPKLVRWTEAAVREDAKKYTTLKEYNHTPGCPTAYRLGIYREVTQHMSGKRPAKCQYWTKEAVLLDAKKHATKSTWRDSSAYHAACRNGWLAEATAHMPKTYVHPPWTKEAVLLDARKYSVRSEWRKQSLAAYRAARKHGWFEEATAAHVADLIFRWTKAAVLESARQFKTKNEWCTQRAGAVFAAKKKGWYAEATAHMPRRVSRWASAKRKAAQNIVGPPEGGGR